MPAAPPRTPFRPRWCALRATVLALAVCGPASADWEGTLRIKVEPPPPMGDGQQDGKISSRGTKLRFDLSRPGMGQVAAIFDYKAKKVLMVMEDKHAFMTMDVDKEPPPGRGGMGPRPLAFCDTSEVAACMEKNGFKKGGNETVNGHKATRWTRDREAPQGTAHDELWTPDGFKEFAMLRQVTKGPERTMTLDVLDLKQAAQAEARFGVPEGYTDMSGMMKGRMGPGGPGGPGGGPGMPPGMPPGAPPAMPPSPPAEPK